MSATVHNALFLNNIDFLVLFLPQSQHLTTQSWVLCGSGCEFAEIPFPDTIISLQHFPILFVQASFADCRFPTAEGSHVPLHHLRHIYHGLKMLRDSGVESC